MDSIRLAKLRRIPAAEIRKSTIYSKFGNEMVKEYSEEFEIHTKEDILTMQTRFVNFFPANSTSLKNGKMT